MQIVTVLTVAILIIIAALLFFEFQVFALLDFQSTLLSQIVIVGLHRHCLGTVFCAKRRSSFGGQTGT
jgi:hypothetical protein